MLTLADRHELTISFKNPYHVINRALPNLTSGLHNERFEKLLRHNITRGMHISLIIQAHNLIFGEIHNIAIHTYTQLSASSLPTPFTTQYLTPWEIATYAVASALGIIKPMNSSRRDLNNGSQASWESNGIRKTSRAHAAPCPRGVQMRPSQYARSWGRGQGHR